jgi:predicted nucleic acid-binding protein
LDSGALIALERPGRALYGPIKRALAHGDRLIVPAGCLAQVWRGGGRQAALAALVLKPGVEVRPLDQAAARQIGELLRRTKTRDIVDAHVAVIATHEDAVIFTSDPVDLRRLAPLVVIAPV